MGRLWWRYKTFQTNNSDYHLITNDLPGRLKAQKYFHKEVHSLLPNPYSLQSVMKMAFAQTIFLSTAIRFCDTIFKVNQYKNTLLLLFTCTETWALRTYLHLETLPIDFPQQPDWHFLFETRHKTRCDWELAPACHQGLWLEEHLNTLILSKHTGAVWRVEIRIHGTQECKRWTMCTKASPFPLSSETHMTCN